MKSVTFSLYFSLPKRDYCILVKPKKRWFYAAKTTAPLRFQPSFPLPVAQRLHRECFISSLRIKAATRLSAG